jgi:hypothetical protein
MTVGMLVLTGVLVLVGAALWARSLRSRNSGHALAGLAVLIVAAIPAAVYASLTS